MKTKYLVTGNEYVSLPTIREQDGAIEGITFLHMGSKGMLEMRGKNENPFLIPFFECDGKEQPLFDFEWTRNEYWIPSFTSTAGSYNIQGQILAPKDERGFGCRLTFKGKASGSSIKIGLRGCWSQTIHSINENKIIDVGINLYPSGWNHSYIMDVRPDVSLFAFAPIFTEEPESCNIKSEFVQDTDSVKYSIYLPVEDNCEEKHEICIWFGIGFEEVAAATSAKEMLRQGFKVEWDKTAKWLRSRIHFTGDAALDELMNINMFFSYFFGGGITLDTEDFVLVTSRSSRYYVSAAYWDRDSLLWSFPAILMVDIDTAKEMLLYVFTKQIRNVGIHSRYIDGTVLEPGFELDELCAPIIALNSYIEVSNDREFLNKECVREGVDRILKILQTKRHPEVALYETFLQPTDDLIVYPYLTYNNVLVWKILNILSNLYEDCWTADKIASLRKEAESVKESIAKHCVIQKDEKPMYVWSVDLLGGWNIYDEPPGSLLLLPHYGFCEKTDTIWLHTAKIIRREDYPYSFAGCPVAEIGCAHAPHPWVLSIANSMLSGQENKAKKHLLFCEMDNKIACESVDEYTGESRTGDAFATCAGFLASSIYKVFGE